MAGPSVVNSRKAENELHAPPDPLYLTFTWVVKSCTLPSALVLCKSIPKVTFRSIVSQNFKGPNWKPQNEMSETLESLICASQHLYLSITLKITMVVLLNTSMRLMDFPTVFQLFSVRTGGRGHSIIPLPTSSVVTHEWVSVRRNLVCSLFSEKKQKNKTKQKWMITKCRNQSCDFVNQM